MSIYQNESEIKKFVSTNKPRATGERETFIPTGFAKEREYPAASINDAGYEAPDFVAVAIGATMMLCPLLATTLGLNG